MSQKPNLVWQSLRRVKWRLDVVLDKYGYKLERKRQGGFSFFSQLLEDRLKTSEQILFVQIGANDGMLSDPLYPLITKCPGQFRGLVVEPLKDKFELLKRAYAGIESVVPVNVAVHNTEREMLIHRVRPDIEHKLPDWARGIASFNAEHYKRSRLDSSQITAEKVICMTLEELLITHKLETLDLLITDTEGYDFEILRNIDFVRYRPTYVHFEHGLTSGVMSWEQYKELVRYMARHGYNISHENDDATAFLPDAFEQTETVESYHRARCFQELRSEKLADRIL